MGGTYRWPGGVLGARLLLLLMPMAAAAAGGMGGGGMGGGDTGGGDTGGGGLSFLRQYTYRAAVFWMLFLWKHRSFAGKNVCF